MLKDVQNCHTFPPSIMKQQWNCARRPWPPLRMPLHPLKRLVASYRVWHAPSKCFRHISQRHMLCGGCPISMNSSRTAPSVGLATSVCSIPNPSANAISPLRRNTQSQSTPSFRHKTALPSTAGGACVFLPNSNFVRRRMASTTPCRRLQRMLGRSLGYR